MNASTCSEATSRINPIVEIKAQVKELVDTLPKLEELTATENFPINIPIETLIMNNYCQSDSLEPVLAWIPTTRRLVAWTETQSVIEFYPVLYQISQNLGSLSNVMFHSTFNALLGYPSNTCYPSNR